MGVRSTQKIQVGPIVVVNISHHNMRSGVPLLWLALMLPHHNPFHHLGKDMLSGLVFPKDSCLGLSLFHQTPNPHCLFSFSCASALMNCAVSLAADPFLTMWVSWAWRTRTTSPKFSGES